MDNNIDPEKLNPLENKTEIRNPEVAPGAIPKPKEFNPLEFGDKSLDVKLEPLGESDVVEEGETVVVEEVKENAGNTDALKGLEYTTHQQAMKHNLVSDAIHENEDLTKPGKAYEALELLIGGETVEKI